MKNQLRQVLQNKKITKCKEKIFLYEFDHSEGSIRKNVSGDFQKIVSIPKLTE